MKTIVLVDVTWGGHHATYLRAFVKALLQLKVRPIVLCPEPEQFLILLVEDGIDRRECSILGCGPVDLRPGHTRFSERVNLMEKIRHVANKIAAAEKAFCQEIDLVFFCYLDSFIGRWQTAFEFELRLGRRFSGLYFQPVHLRKKHPNSWMHYGPFHPDAVLRSQKCPAVAVLDENIAGRLSQVLRGKRVVWFPDVTRDEIEIDRTLMESDILARARGRRIIGLLGSLDKRKGVMELLEHADALRGYPVCFLIAGRWIPESFSAAEIAKIRHFLEMRRDNVFVYAGAIQDGPEFNNLVRCCDLLYAVYNQFPHSSNLLTKAACFKVPIAVSGRYLMGERIRKYKIGFEVNEDSAADFRKLIIDGRPFEAQSDLEFIEGCQKYLNDHSFGNLVAAFEQIVYA